MSQQENAVGPKLLSGWWYVLLLLVPAMYFQEVGPGRQTWHRPPDEGSILVADCLIGLRAVLGLTLQQKGGWWPVYCFLYLALPSMAFWVASWID